MLFILISDIFLFQTAQVYLKLNRRTEAEAEYMKLLDRNADNRQYYVGLEEARDLHNKGEDAKLQLYDELRVKYPRSTLIRRIPLNYATSENFRLRVDNYLRHALHKGAPPLFVDLRSLYSDIDKVAIIENLLLSYVTNLKAFERFSEIGNEIFLGLILLKLFLPFSNYK